MKCPICGNNLIERFKNNNILHKSNIYIYDCPCNEHMFQIEFHHHLTYKIYIGFDKRNNISAILYPEGPSLFIDCDMVNINYRFIKSIFIMEHFQFNYDDLMFIKNKVQTYFLFK